MDGDLLMARPTAVLSTEQFIAATECLVTPRRVSPHPQAQVGSVVAPGAGLEMALAEQYPTTLLRHRHQ